MRLRAQVGVRNCRVSAEELRLLPRIQCLLESVSKPDRLLLVQERAVQPHGRPDERMPTGIETFGYPATAGAVDFVKSDATESRDAISIRLDPIDQLAESCAPSPFRRRRLTPGSQPTTSRTRDQVRANAR